MNSQACELCGSDKMQTIPGTRMKECQNCTIQYPKEIPATGIVTNQAPISPTGRGTLLARAQAKLVSRVNNRQCLVDLGCGNGAFLHAFRQHDDNNCRIIGVELDELSANAARATGITVAEKVPRDLTDAMITMWHVAEHFPVHELKLELTKLSQGNNLLLVSVPNGNSHSWKKHHEKFSFYDSKSHMVQYTPTSLIKLLQDSGWDIQQKFRTPVYGFFNAIQTGINLTRPHNEVYNSIKREGKSFSIALISRNLFAAIRAIIPILSMVIHEFSKERGSSFTVLATTRKLQCD